MGRSMNLTNVKLTAFRWSRVKFKRCCFPCCALLILSCLFCNGCARRAVEESKQPRPVSVRELYETRGQQSQTVTGVAAPWKTEQIGFEVQGRIAWVIEPDRDIERQVLEPDRDIEGQVFDGDREIIVPGTILSHVEDEEFVLNVESAEAGLEVAKNRLQAAQVNAEKSIPADIVAADAEVELAEVTFKRQEKLSTTNAIAKSEVDESRAKYRTAKARREQLDAKQISANVQVTSEKLKVRQAENDLADAKRQLSDTKLFSSFRGQIAKVHVVPGSVVSPGEPVVTVQMMDPIKVELEVSAAQSRRLQYRDVLPVFLTDRYGEIRPASGYVYMIDTAADPRTRTFTLTLLVRNEKTNLPNPNGKTEAIARTTQLWPANFDFLPGNKEKTFSIEERSIQRDDNGQFIWRAKNRVMNESITDENRLLKVEKVYIKVSDRRIPFLGNWVFRGFEPVEEGTIDPKKDLFVGAITVDEGKPEDFDGDSILMDDERWSLRPGDLVQVDLSGSKNLSAGLFVPMNNVVEKGGKKYIFVVDGNEGDTTTAKQVEVKVSKSGGEFSPASAQLRIEPVDNNSLAPGSKIITGGVHYLQNGDQVRIQSIQR